jgi:hypothetical protein
VHNTNIARKNIPSIGLALDKIKDLVEFSRSYHWRTDAKILMRRHDGRDTRVQVREQDFKRLVARGSEPSARQKPIAAESGGVGAAAPTCLSLPAVASRLQDKPSTAESGGVGTAVPTCDSAIRESASASAPGQALTDRAAGIALGRAGV